MSGADGKGRDDGRDNHGRFTRSGNPSGRPRKVDPSRPISRRKAIARVADRRVSVRVTGDPSGREYADMSVYEACVYQLGLIGARGNRIAARDFIQLAMHHSIAAEQHERHEAHMQRRMAAVDPEFLAYIEGAEKRRDEFLASLDKQYGPGRDDDQTDPDGTTEDPLDEEPGTP